MAHSPADPHSQPAHDANHDGKASLLVVIFSLALFFAMTVVGHYVFIAGNAHDTASPASHHPDQH